LLSLQLKGRIRELTVLLAAFIFIHGSYHILLIFGYNFIGAGIVDPASVLILILFGLYYLGLLRRNKSTFSRKISKV
jgi:hypothetical protein